MLVALFFASGALALVYQVLWQRQLALLFGSGSAATAAVLAAFLAGLGLGSAWIGRLAPRCGRPLRAYAGLELLIGLAALGVPWALSAFEPAFPWLEQRLGDNHAALLAAKSAVAFLALAVPTIAMGATLPMLAQGLDHGPRRFGLTAGRYYVANTAGAAVGALAVPFALLPMLGMQQTLLLGALANAVVAAIAWHLDRRNPRPAPPAIPHTNPAQPSTTPAPAARPNQPIHGLLALAFTSGAATFALQVLWNRAFAQVHENSLHAFAIIAAVFILALAAGGQFARVTIRRGAQPRRLLAHAWTAAGLMTLVSPWAFVAATGHLAYLGTAGGGSPPARLFTLAALLLLLPVALLGTGLPALMEAAGRESATPPGPLLGRLLGVNIAGCVTGALLAGFILPPWPGLWGSMILTGAVVSIAARLARNTPAPAPASVPTSASTPARSHRRRDTRPTPKPTSPAPAVAAWTVAALLAFIAVRDLPRVRIAPPNQERLLDLREGPHGIVAVTERPGSRRLKLNNHYALGGSHALGDQRMQSHIPLLLHPNPRRVGHLGLGTGLSASGILFHPVTSAEIVELVPEVIVAARNHFTDGSAGLFTDPRVRILHGDARLHLRTRPEPYDVLIGDLVVPWRPGESSLFTLEHFQAARNALRPDGLFCLWLPMFQLSETETRIVLRTFLAVFPNAALWRADFSPDRPAIGLVGSTQPFQPNPATVRARLAESRPDPANPQLAVPFGFWMGFLGLLEPADLDPSESRRHTEDHPWLELLGARTHRADAKARQGTFTGRPLQRWLAQTRNASSTRLPGLAETETAAIAAGDRLFEFSLALLENQPHLALQIRRDLERQFPPEVARAVFGPPLP